MVMNRGGKGPAGLHHHTCRQRSLETLVELFQPAGSWVPGGTRMCTWILELWEVVA